MKKGDRVYLSGLFDPGFAGTIAVFEEEVKRHGQPLKWRVTLEDPTAQNLAGGSSMVATAKHFINETETQCVNFDIARLVELNKSQPQEMCCEKYTSRFCPECGSVNQ